MNNPVTCLLREFAMANAHAPATIISVISIIYLFVKLYLFECDQGEAYRGLLISLNQSDAIWDTGLVGSKSPKVSPRR